MYRKILVPLDGSIKEVEGILARAQSVISPEGEGILLHVVPPGESRYEGLYPKLAAQQEKEQRYKAMGYLKYFADGLSTSGGNWRCEVVVSKQVTQGILDFAAQEQVDLIVMYTHSRKGLAKLFKPSVSEQVQAKATTEVMLIRPRDLALSSIGEVRER